MSTEFVVCQNTNKRVCQVALVVSYYQSGFVSQQRGDSTLFGHNDGRASRNRFRSGISEILIL